MATYLYVQIQMLVHLNVMVDLKIWIVPTAN